jgi:TRAP-type C4-dicarboxylate transport system permease small subunit
MKLLFFPFVVIGIIQVIRGFFAIVEKDLHSEIPYDELPRKAKIMAWTYWIITIISYTILFIAIQNIE